MSQTPRSRQSSLFNSISKRIAVAIGSLLALATCVPAGAQMQIVPTINTVAGNGSGGFSGDGGLATAASLSFPRGPAFDGAGNLYVSDFNNGRVRKIAPNGIITTIAGNGTATSTGDGGPATSAGLYGPEGIAVDSASNVYICEFYGHRIRKVDATTGLISTVVGTGVAGFSGDGGPGTAAKISGPANPNFDGAGNFYWADYGNNRVRKLNVATGIVTTVAGNGAGYSGDGGPATSAGISGPVSTVFDSAGNMYISERDGFRLRRVAAGTGIITTIAGTGIQGSTGDGGPATSAKTAPYGITFDVSGNIIVSEPSQNRVRMINILTGIITTIAGTGTAGYSGDGGPATSATLNGPFELVTDFSGHVYICDSNNSRVREITLPNINFPDTTIGSRTTQTRFLQLQTTANETISSITVPQSLGGKQEYSVEAISGCAVDGTTINPQGTTCTIPISFTPAYPGRRWIPLQVVTSTGNINFGLTGIGVGPLAVLTPGIVSTVAGSGTGGYSGDGGAATGAQIQDPNGVAVDNAGNIYISDWQNNRIRKVTAATGIITTVAGNGTAGYTGDGGAATGAEINWPQSIAIDSAGNLYFAEYNNHVVRKVNIATGIITTYAGNGTGGFAGDGGPATSAELDKPVGVAFDDAGNLYIADDGVGMRIRKVNAATGIITSIAGNGTAGYSGDGGPATSAEINLPYSPVFDSKGNLFFADTGNNRIRKIDTSGVITTYAGSGTAGYSGDGGPATSAEFNNPYHLAIDPADNIYVSDTSNQRLRKINAATGKITTIAGIGTSGFSGDGGVSTSAKFFNPVGVDFDIASGLYVGDTNNNRIRKIDLSQSALNYPTPTTVGSSDSTDNPQSAILSDIGNADLPIPAPASGSNPNISSNFGFDSSSTCPELLSSSSAQTLASGAECTIAINFNPVQAGALTGTAVETDSSLNIPGSTQTIHLTATGIAATTTILTSSLNPSAHGQSVTFSATVSPTGTTAVPPGTVQFSIDGTAVGGPVTLVNGVATYVTSTLAVGTHTITAVYTPDSSNFTASNGSLTQTVNAASTTTTVASSVNPSSFMQSVTFTATVAPTAGTAQPTGTVQFAVDGLNQGSPVTLSGGTAAFSISTLAVGLHTITATYTPDTSNFTGSNGSVGQRVGAIATSTTVLSVAPATVMYGDTATLTAVVTPAFATGTASFYEGATLLGTASLDSTATAVLPISTLSAGVHTIVAKYNGDPGVPANTSNTAQLTVTKRTAAGGGPAITVTVNDASRTTTQANPPFTYSAAGQLVNGDTYATAISGTPSYSTAAGTSAGTYSITVSGLTSANYEVAFVPGTLTVTISPSTTTLVASPTSTQYGDPVTLTATVTSGATGTVSFYDGSVLVGTGQVTNGVATLTTTTLVAGTHNVTAVYNGDATYASSQSSPATVTVAKKQGPGGIAALTITVQNASREYNTADPQFAYVVRGTLVNGDSYATAVTGTPVYSSTDTATSPAGSTFPISVSGLNSANYEIAVVNGTLTIVTAPTTTTLTTSQASAQYGDPVTLTATVAPSGATGSVLFMNGSTVLGTGTVSNGVARLTISSLPAGSYTITAFYQGDANYSASTSSPVSLTINQKTGPGGVAALTITVTNASRGYGQGNPAFTYTVSGTLVNGDTYATALSGVPVFSTSAVPLSPAGSYPISIAGLNSQNYLITFVNGTLAVTKDTPGQNGVANITLTSSLNPSPYSKAVTFTASVPAPATGTVQFFDGTTLLGTGTVANGTATLTISTLAVGTHPVTAVYSGDPDYNSASSAAYGQIVTAQTAVLDFTLTLTSSGTQTVIPGNVANYTVQVAPTNVNYPGTVTFSATGLPAGATISFSPSTVAANGGTQPISVKVQTAAQKAALDTGIGSAALALLMLPLATSRRIRRSSRRYFYLLILVLGGIGATAGLTGCGYNGNGFFGQAPQTYTITITATSGTIQHSANVTLNVQ